MAAPQVTIDELPEKTDTPDGGEWIVLQDDEVTVKMSMANVRLANGVDAHIANPTDAHDATAISATVSGTGFDGANVQVQLAQLATRIITNTGLITNNGTAITTLNARRINTTAPLTGGGDLSADRTLGVSDFTSAARGTVPASGGGSTNFLRADGTWSIPTVVNDPELQAIAGLASAIDTIPYFTGVGAAALASFPSYGRTLVASGTPAVARTNLGLVIGTDVPPARRVPITVSTTTCTPDTSYENRMVLCTATGATTITLPSDATQAIPVGGEVDVLWQAAAAAPVFVAGSGATLTGTPGLKLRAQWSKATAKKIAANTWVVYGDLMA